MVIGSDAPMTVMLMRPHVNGGANVLQLGMNLTLTHDIVFTIDVVHIQLPPDPVQ